MARRGKAYWYDEQSADRAVFFFENFLTHTKGEWAGQPFILAPWQRRLVQDAFGWKLTADGLRRYRRVDIWIPRKNGKSTLVAGMMAYLLFGDREPAAELYGLATNKEQAAIVYKELAAMIRAAPELVERCQIFSSTKAVLVPETMSSYRVLSADPRDKDGLNIHGLACDELHEWQSQDLLNKLLTAQGSRREPMAVFASTAGVDRASLGYREYQKSKKIRDGEIKDDERLVFIAEASPDDDWTKPETWRKANPTYPVSPKDSFIRKQCEDAKVDPVVESAFKRYHLNIWTQSLMTWMPMLAWQKCGTPVINVETLRGRPCWVGLDLSSREDLTAAVAVFKLDEQTLFLLPRFWLPANNIVLKEQRDAVPYRAWADAGHLTLTPGDVIDYSYVRNQLAEWASMFRVLEVPHDPYGSTQLAVELMDMGVTPVQFPQGIKHIGGPTKDFKALVLQHRIRHNGHPVLAWCAENCEAIVDSTGNEKISKRSRTKRVDGIIASIMGTARATVGGDAKSVYETRGVTEV